MDQLDALRIFIDVAERGSFSAVARSRAIATSTVTLAINQLEQVFDVRLLARSTRRLAFTHEGQALLADARRLVSNWDATLLGLRPGTALAGPIRLTAPNDFGRQRLRPVLDAFQLRYPQVHVAMLLSDNTIDPMDAQIDLAVRFGPLQDSNLQARLLVPGTRCVCAAPAYWQRHGRPAHPDDLARHNCLVLARYGAPQSTWRFCADDRPFAVKVRGDRQASDGAVLREWATQGIGVIQTNCQDIGQALATGELERVLEDFGAGPVDLFAVHTGNPPSVRVAALVEHLASHLA